jgi:hypothetical protein
VDPQPEIGAWQAFRGGLSRSARYPQLVLVAYLASLVAGLILLLIPALSLTGPAHRPAVREAADGIDAWLVLEFEESPLTAESLMDGQDPIMPPGFQQGLLVGLITLTCLLPLVWITASFLDGAILGIYSQAPAPFGWRGFLSASWHWLPAFLLFNAIQFVAGAAVFLALLGAVNLAGRLGWALIALMLVVWLAWTECTRAIAVGEGTRNIFRAAGRAALLIFRRPLRVFAFYALALAPLLALHLAFRAGIMPRLPLDWWPLVLLVGQVFILLRLWARLARWAGLLQLASQAPTSASRSTNIAPIVTPAGTDATGHLPASPANEA